MQTRQIGSINVSTIGIGCNNFGRQLELEATRGVVDAALAAGVAFFDTADSYGSPPTTSESFLGEILGPRRNDIVLATKFGRVLDDRRKGAGAAYVRQATEASLARLRTDRIDLMQLHIPDPSVPIEETLGALAELLREGKILEIGCSNFGAGELAAAQAAAAAAGLPRFASTQDELSALCRRRAEPILAECRRTGTRFLPFRPLFNGLLSGKYRPGAPLQGKSRIGSKSAVAQAEILSPDNLAKVDALARYAADHGRSLLELAIGWLLAHPEVPSVIAGVSSPTQVRSNVAASDWTIAPGQMAEIEGILSASQAA
ncbi:aldo/keto reductase [Mangrovicoccus sp. HB161399]|uniref:aldo/keto reductase n=1 Tax=Mangrovicoccus sp. HB161399 TaxID=2720392 RepID=UPI001556CF73|nr:aldo/keto reductase [Mangrovicoccus sp. HB161399]